MAETDAAFIERIDKKFHSVSSMVDKTSALVKGRDTAGIPVPSPLLQVVDEAENKKVVLGSEFSSIKNMTSQNQPIDEAQKRKIDDDLKILEGDAIRLKEGLDFAVDAQSPSWFAWIVFLVGIAVLIGGLILYVALHKNRPTALLRGISDEQRLAAIDTLAAIRVRATLLEELLAQESAFKDADDKKTIATLRGNIQNTLREGVDTLSVITGMSADTGSLYNELKHEVNPTLSPEAGSKSLNSKAIIIYSNQIGKTIRDLKEPYFWDRGAGRYAEVLFASFFGVMVFALYNWWKHMRRPARNWWLGWYVAKIFLALIVSFAFVAILSQVNFTTPSSLQSQTAFGLGTAPIEIVIAVSILAGYFGHKALESLESYADRLFGSIVTG
jgi:hypothetical protein